MRISFLTYFQPQVRNSFRYTKAELLGKKRCAVTHCILHGECRHNPSHSSSPTLSLLDCHADHSDQNHTCPAGEASLEVCPLGPQSAWDDCERNNHADVCAKSRCNKTPRAKGNKQCLLRGHVGRNKGDGSPSKLHVLVTCVPVPSVKPQTADMREN